jgi:CTP synthase
VISASDADDIYRIPLRMHRENLDGLVVRMLGLECGEPDLSEWRALVDRIDACDKPVTIALVGKYVQLHEAYLSVWEALKHSAFHHGRKLELLWVDSEELTPATVADRLGCADGVIVPGGFGRRGIEGKLKAIRLARETKVPFFGICLGLQCAVIEYARNVCGIKDANSTEFEPNSPNKVIYMLRDLIGVEALGGTMRLGKYPCDLGEGTLARRAYGEATVWERHRHRYEVNQEYLPALRDAGMTFCGMSPDRKFVEMVELSDHPWFLGCQFHPEFKSKPMTPHPLFKDFIRAARAHKHARQDGLDKKSAELAPAVVVPANLPTPNGQSA